MDGIISHRPTPLARASVITARPVWRLFLIVSGLLLLGYVAVFIVRDRHFDPYLSFVLSAGIALSFLGCLINSEWRAFASWASLGLIGQTAALHTIDAGRQIHFQHYPSIPELIPQKPGIPSIASIQAAVVLIATIKRREKVIAAVKTVGVRPWPEISARRFAEFDLQRHESFQSPPVEPLPELI